MTGRLLVFWMSSRLLPLKVITRLSFHDRFWWHLSDSEIWNYATLEIGWRHKDIREGEHDSSWNRSHLERDCHLEQAHTYRMDSSKFNLLPVVLHLQCIPYEAAITAA